MAPGSGQVPTAARPAFLLLPLLPHDLWAPGPRGGRASAGTGVFSEATCSVVCAASPVSVHAVHGGALASTSASASASGWHRPLATWAGMWAQGARTEAAEEGSARSPLWSVRAARSPGSRPRRPPRPARRLLPAAHSRHPLGLRSRHLLQEAFPDLPTHSVRPCRGSHHPGWPVLAPQHGAQRVL